MEDLGIVCYKKKIPYLQRSLEWKEYRKAFSGASTCAQLLEESSFSKGEMSKFGEKCCGYGICMEKAGEIYIENIFDTKLFATDFSYTYNKLMYSPDGVATFSCKKFYEIIKKMRYVKNIKEIYDETPEKEFEKHTLFEIKSPYNWKEEPIIDNYRQLQQGILVFDKGLGFKCNAILFRGNYRIQVQSIESFEKFKITNNFYGYFDYLIDLEKNPFHFIPEKFVFEEIYNNNAILTKGVYCFNKKRKNIIYEELVGNVRIFFELIGEDWTFVEEDESLEKKINEKLDN